MTLQFIDDWSVANSSIVDKPMALTMSHFNELSGGVPRAALCSLWFKFFDVGVNPNGSINESAGDQPITVDPSIP